MIRKGDVVTIYQDPITELEREGTAKIVDKGKTTDDGLCLCMVQFDDDDPDSKHLRLVNAETS